MKRVIAESRLRFFEPASSEIEHIMVCLLTLEYYGLFPFELRRLEMHMKFTNLERKHFPEKFDMVSGNKF